MVWDIDKDLRALSDKLGLGVENSNVPLQKLFDVGMRNINIARFSDFVREYKLVKFYMPDRSVIKRLFGCFKYIESVLSSQFNGLGKLYSHVRLAMNSDGKYLVVMQPNEGYDEARKILDSLNIKNKYEILDSSRSYSSCYDGDRCVIVIYEDAY